MQWDQREYSALTAAEERINRFYMMEEIS